MSIEIVLIPLAMAGYAAWQARSIEKDNTCLVETRLKDPVLLAEALTETGATDVSVSESGVTARWGDVNATFDRRADESLTAHFSSDDRDHAMTLVSAVDQAYGRAVQRIVVQRVQERASSMGMEVMSQMDTNEGAVTIVLEEVHA